MHGSYRSDRSHRGEVYQYRSDRYHGADWRHWSHGRFHRPDWRVWSYRPYGNYHWLNRTQNRANRRFRSDGSNQLRDRSDRQEWPDRSRFASNRSDRVDRTYRRDGSDRGRFHYHWSSCRSHGTYWGHGGDRGDRTNGRIRAEQDRAYGPDGRYRRDWAHRGQFGCYRTDFQSYRCDWWNRANGRIVSHFRSDR